MSKYTLHKLSEGFIITSDEQQLRDYKGLMLNTVVNKLFTDMGVSLMRDFKKVIAQQDQIDFSALSEEEQKEIGWFDVEKLANEYSDYETKSKWGDIVRNTYKEGFKKAQELLSDRKFTLDDILDAWELGAKEGLPLTRQKKEDLIQSLSQPKSWSVELDVEHILFTNASSSDLELSVNGLQDVVFSNPKLTGGKVKMLKLL